MPAKNAPSLCHYLDPAGLLSAGFVFRISCFVCVVILLKHEVAISRFYTGKGGYKENDTPQSTSRALSDQPTIRKLTPVPEESRRLFWVRKALDHKLYEPVIRAFHSRGYSITEDYERAHMLWSDHPFRFIWENEKPWQRNAWIPHINKWDDKDSMAFYVNKYFAQKKKEPLHSFPESYLLHNEEDFRRFQKRLRDGGIDDPWVLKQPTVNQGKGVQIVGPRSPTLQRIASDKYPSPSRIVAQKYICDELTYSGRKFDFRVFWMVASVDPLIVLYQTEHNYVRIGHADYDESDFSNTKSHLTTHTFGADEGKATWDEFKVYINEFHKLQGERLSHIENPFQHLENQVKHVLATLADAFKDLTYHTRNISAENAYTWHAADLILDNDLDVYLIEGTDGPGKDEDYDFRIDMHNAVFGDMIDVVEEVTRRQELGLQLDMKAMEDDGVLGSYDIVYNDGWMFEYWFDRPSKRGCSIPNADNAIAKIESQMHLAEIARMNAALTALPKHTSDTPLKSFYMEGRTGQGGEPIARSLRRQGWAPIDDEGSAQLIYRKHWEDEFPSNFLPWQFFNQFPKEERFLDSRSEDRVACDPLLYNGRRFTVEVYWLVLSLDPLIVFYHDGFLRIPYDKNDENEFLPGSPVWRGSWAGFKYKLSRATPMEDPMSHVKGQMKQSLVQVSKDFAEYVGDQGSRSAPQSFGVYRAEFELDRNLNVLDPKVSRMKVFSEGYQEIVDMHDDIFGSTSNLLEKFNTTNFDLYTAMDPVKGGFELIFDGERDWEFEFSTDNKAQACRTA